VQNEPRIVIDGAARIAPQYGYVNVALRSVVTDVRSGDSDSAPVDAPVQYRRSQ